MNDRVRSIINLLVTLAVPIILCNLTILLLLSPLYINFEYQRPGFPQDSYGFSTEERLLFGNQTRRYLVTTQSLDALRDLAFPDGDPLYKERELAHLEDVKVVLQGLLRVFYGAAGIFVLGATLAWGQGWQTDLLQAVFRGGRLTAIMLVTILFFTLISFQALFTNFHRLFFEGDSWLFYTSDTLIRLFPIQFWQDVFLAFGLITLAGSGLLGWGIPAWKKSSARKREE